MLVFGDENHPLQFRQPLTNAQLSRRYRKKQETHIAILDLETDPFDKDEQTDVKPFLAILYGDRFSPIIIWNNDWHKLVSDTMDAIISLPDRYIIYAHNGGRFDFMFFLSHIRGKIKFKGRAVMSAQVGRHELRDSLHIIPESLRNANRKDDIDYSLLKKQHREKYRQRITDYCLSDCRYTFEIVSAFRERFGSPITIGQAAMREVRKHYDFDRLTESSDTYFRQWFFGGRVECFHYGLSREPCQLFDVNSMYPYVMATYSHPVGSSFVVNDHIRDNTIFLTLDCENRGALVCRDGEGGLSARVKRGIFQTTIWEYEIAKRYGLIQNETILRTVEFSKRSNFSRFVNPLYAGRFEAKQQIVQAKTRNDRDGEIRWSQRALFDKYLLNNAYGKFAQNPRNFKVHEITAPLEHPDPLPQRVWDTEPREWRLEIETDDYWIWSAVNPEWRFYNVATAASITGAARAVLLEAIVTSVRPMYVDTDSIICVDFSNKCKIDPYALGAWDLEAKLSAFIGNGKKLYAYQRSDKEPPDNQIIRAKGMNGVTWQDMLDISEGKTIKKTMNAPTIYKDGSQQYITRELRRTGVV